MRLFRQFLSPLVVVMASLALIVAVFALLIRLLQRRPLRNWSLIALTSLLLVIVFAGISNALYGGGQSQQASSPSEPTEELTAPTEKTSIIEETTARAERTTEQTTQAQKSTQGAETVAYQASTPSTSACPPSNQALGGIYHPERFKVLDPCLEASGTVAKVLHEKDGDLHIRLTLDDQYGSLLSEGNNSKQHGDLVVEYMARDAGHLTEPKTGDHLDVVGVWVTDNDHDWNEIHPVFSASLNGGQEETSGPQFGGNPTSDRSSNAAADCRTETAQACPGYGRGTDSSDEPSDSEADKSAPPQPSPQPVPAPTPDVPSAPVTPSGGSRPPISKNSCPSDAPIKGNQSGIYHPPGSRSYNVTNPEECFATPADAEAAGYRAPKQ